MQKKLNKKIIATLLLMAFAGISQAKDLQKVTGLKMPESVVQAKDGTIYISEINGFDKDGDGQISKLDRDGKLTVFATGMDDPKGLAIIGDKLYVADKTRILEVSKDGTWKEYTSAAAFASKPKFLNDLEADHAGNLYVSDSGDLKSGGQIYKISKGGSATLVADSKNSNVLAPNGLLSDGPKQLLEVDFESGTLYRINLANGKFTKLAEGFGGADGLVKTKTGKIFISDWKTGKIYKAVNGKAVLVKEGYQSAADIALTNDGKTLMVPDMKAGELDFIPAK
ncbi:MAG: SMP-30/gluconolactonase/LRE family protein [Methylotenera sp.]|nr:SMP-30/gluconolactonase/LRE family protein [Methylotenera sp.]